MDCEYRAAGADAAGADSDGADVAGVAASPSRTAGDSKALGNNSTDRLPTQKSASSVTSTGTDAARLSILEELDIRFGTAKNKQQVLHALEHCSVLHRIPVSSPQVTTEQARKDFRRERVLLNDVPFIPDQVDQHRCHAFALTLGVLLQRLRCATSTATTTKNEINHDTIARVNHEQQGEEGEGAEMATVLEMTDAIMQRACRTSAGADSFFMVQKLLCVEDTFVTQRAFLSDPPIKVDVFLAPTAAAATTAAANSPQAVLLKSSGMTPPTTAGASKGGAELGSRGGTSDENGSSLSCQTATVGAGVGTGDKAWSRALFSSLSPLPAPVPSFAEGPTGPARENSGTDRDRSKRAMTTPPPSSHPEPHPHPKVDVAAGSDFHKMAKRPAPSLCVDCPARARADGSADGSAEGSAEGSADGECEKGKGGKGGGEERKPHHAPLPSRSPFGMLRAFSIGVAVRTPRTPHHSAPSPDSPSSPSHLPSSPFPSPGPTTEPEESSQPPTPPSPPALSFASEESPEQRANIGGESRQRSNTSASSVTSSAGEVVCTTSGSGKESSPQHKAGKRRGKKTLLNSLFSPHRRAAAAAGAGAGRSTSSKDPRGGRARSVDSSSPYNSSSSTTEAGLPHTPVRARGDSSSGKPPSPPRSQTQTPNSSRGNNRKGLWCDAPGDASCDAGGLGEHTICARIQVMNSFAVYDMSAIEQVTGVAREDPPAWLEVEAVVVDESDFRTHRHWRKLQLIVTCPATGRVYTSASAFSGGLGDEDPAALRASGRLSGRMILQELSSWLPLRTLNIQRSLPAVPQPGPVGGVGSLGGGLSRGVAMGQGPPSSSAPPLTPLQLYHPYFCPFPDRGDSNLDSNLDSVRSNYGVIADGSSTVADDSSAVLPPHLGLSELSSLSLTSSRPATTSLHRDRGQSLTPCSKQGGEAADATPGLQLTLTGTEARTRTLSTTTRRDVQHHQPAPETEAPVGVFMKEQPLLRHRHGGPAESSSVCLWAHSDDGADGWVGFGRDADRESGGETSSDWAALSSVGSGGPQGGPTASLVAYRSARSTALIQGALPNPAPRSAAAAAETAAVRSATTASASVGASGSGGGGYTSVVGGAGGADTSVGCTDPASTGTGSGSGSLSGSLKQSAQSRPVSYQSTSLSRPMSYQSTSLSVDPDYLLVALPAPAPVPTPVSHPVSCSSSSFSDSQPAKATGVNGPEGAATTAATATAKAKAMPTSNGTTVAP